MRRLSCRATTSPSAASSAATSSAPRQPQRHRDRVGRRSAPFQPVQEPQPPLRKRQRHLGSGARTGTQRRPRRLAPASSRSASAATVGASNRLRIASSTSERGADAADQPRRQQRMPAELEEVVVDADRAPRPAPRRTAPHRISSCGVRGARAHRAASSPAPAARGGRACRSASAAAAPAPRTPTAPCSPAGSRATCARSAAASALASCARHHIGDQPLVAGRVLARDHRRLRHAGMPRQRRLDLARLDAEAADLHLLVGAPEELQHPVRAPARQVAGAVHPAARQARTGRPRTAPPSARRAPDSRAPAPRPRCTARPPPPPAPAAGRRPAHRPACWQIGRPIGTCGADLLGASTANADRIDRGLGRAVEIDEPARRRDARRSARADAAVQRLAAEHQMLAARSAVRSLVAATDARQRRHAAARTVTRVRGSPAARTARAARRSRR